MFLLLKKRDGYQRQPPRFIQLFPLRTTLIIVFLLCTRLEEIVHVCLHGVDHPHLLFEPCAFIVEPLLFFQKLLLLRLQCLQARQLFFSLHGKQCASRRLKDHKLRFVLCLEGGLYAAEETCRRSQPCCLKHQSDLPPHQLHRTLLCGRYCRAERKAG